MQPKALNYLEVLVCDKRSDTIPADGSRLDGWIYSSAQERLLFAVAGTEKVVKCRVQGWQGLEDLLVCDGLEKIALHGPDPASWQQAVLLSRLQNWSVTCCQFGAQQLQSIHLRLHFLQATTATTDILP